MNKYDAIVVGARCAGSPTAMLLARKGYRVLLVDRATFPSDTISTHLIHPPGVTALNRWGLLGRLMATGCPAIHTYAFDMGPFVISGTPGSSDSPVSYGPRRTVLDKLLVDAASEAGAEVREGFSVDDILIENGNVTGIRGRGTGGQPVTEHARVVVGADGLHSLVSRMVGAEQYNEKPECQAGYYTYWSGLEIRGAVRGVRSRRSRLGGLAHQRWPHAGRCLMAIRSVRIEQEGYRAPLPRGVRTGAVVRGSHPWRQAGRALRRHGRPNFFRKPFGAGWALVGDAGYNKDFITAQGISDAFRDAELLVTALDEWLSGTRAFEIAMGGYQSARDRHVQAIYEFTCQFAMLAPPPPDMRQLLGAVHGNPDAMNGFVRVISGVVSPAEFFSRENVGRIFAAAATRQGVTGMKGSS